MYYITKRSRATITCPPSSGLQPSKERLATTLDCKNYHSNLELIDLFTIIVACPCSTNTTTPIMRVTTSPTSPIGSLTSTSESCISPATSLLEICELWCVNVTPATTNYSAFESEEASDSEDYSSPDIITPTTSASDTDSQVESDIDTVYMNTQSLVMNRNIDYSRSHLYQVPHSNFLLL